MLAPHRRRRSARPEAVLALVAAAFVVVFVASQRLAPSSTQPAHFRASQVLDHPSRFVGRTVRVEDRVSDVLTARAITLGPGRLLVLDLVSIAAIDDVGDGEGPTGELVAVRGRVETFHLTEIEREVGVLDAKTFTPFEGSPVVIADTMQPAPTAATR